MKGFGDIYKSKLKKEKVHKKIQTESQIIGLAVNNHLKGNIVEATKFYNIAINEGFADDAVFANYGLILQDSGNLKDAEKFTLKAIELNPNFANAYSNLSGILRDLGKLNDAEKSALKAIELDPNSAQPRSNMASILKDLGKLNDAEKSARKAIELDPNFADAYYNLGGILIALGKLKDAEMYTLKAIEINPNFPGAYYNMGAALQKQNQLEESLAAYEKALSLNPQNADVYNNMGVALSEKGNKEKAITSYKKALSLKPDNAEIYYNMGYTLTDQGKLDKAIASYEYALSLNPNYSAARVQKLHQQAHICDWPSIDKDRSYFNNLGIIGDAVTPLSMLSLEDAPDRHRLRSELYAKERLLQKPLPPIAKPSIKPKRLRIGYFSSDFKEHPVAYLISKVIEKHNRSKFEVFGYSLNDNKKNEMRQRLSKSFDSFLDVQGMSNKDIAMKARKDKIDIAIDLNGYTQNARPDIFAYRAAPVQINYLGYPGTLGAEFMDYIVADKYLIPPGTEKYFNEKKIYLPNTYMPTDNSREISERCITRSEMGLPEDGFVFCCFNNNYKITSSEFNIWMRLLNKVEGSVLWLRQSNQFSHINIKKEAEKRNVDPSRIVFAQRAPMDEHLARQKLANLFIDTFAFNAHTTATEALWAGLPVITKTGKGFASRVAGSLLNAIGLPELIAETEQDYEDLALELATNQVKLNKIRKKLVQNRLSYPLFDTIKYTHHLETAFQIAYDRYLKDQDVDNIFVPN